MISARPLLGKSLPQPQIKEERMHHNCDIEIDDDDIKEYINKKYAPDDIFDVDALADWALSSGFKRE